MFRAYILVLIILSSAFGQTQRTVEEIYNKYCATCHGPKLAGGLGPSLLSGKWLYGSDDASLAESIRAGRAEGNMPAFTGQLTEAEIRALVIYIREQLSKTGPIAPAPKAAEGSSVRTALHSYRLEVVVPNLQTPWSIAFLPNGGMLFTEKSGRLQLLEKGASSPVNIAGIPPVWDRGQGGLLAVGVPPDYERDPWIYLGYSEPSADGKTAMTALIRGRLGKQGLQEQQVLFRAPEKHFKSAGVHFGTRLVFDGRGHLFFSIGDRGSSADAQDLSLPNGKVHRIKTDGGIPGDNPFAGRENTYRSIWTYGNRNAQGLALRPGSEELWETEHGPRGGDELNLLKPGANYGWPLVTLGMNYNGTPMTDKTSMPGMTDSIIHWTPSIAVCALHFYTGAGFPKWRGNAFVTALIQQELRRLVIVGTNVVEQEVILKNIGRVRDVTEGPDGSLYLALNQPDQIVRLIPIE